MGKTVLVTSGAPVATVAGATAYWYVGNSSLGRSATEANRQVKFYTAGTFSKLYLRVTANAASADRTFRLRINGTNGNSVITIHPGEIGVFEDTVHTDTIASGDLVCYESISTGTGTTTIGLISSIFESSNPNETVSKFVSSVSTTNASVTFANASTTRYNQPAGEMSSAITAEPSAQMTMRENGTLRALSMFVSANARTTPTVIRSRKNLADGTQNFSIGAGGIGWFADSTNTDTITVGDEIDTSLATGTGTEILTAHAISLEFVTINNVGISSAARPGALSHLAGTTDYLPISGNLVVNTIEADKKVKSREPFTYSQLSVNVTANTLTSSAVLRFRKNGADGNQVITINPGQVAILSDTTNIDVCNSEDEVNYSLSSPAGGTALIVRNVSVNALHVPVLEPEPEAGAGAVGRRQGRSPIYNTKPKAVAVIIRLKVQLQYQVTQVIIVVAVPYENLRPKPAIKYASAIITPVLNILPLRQRPTPKPVVRMMTTQLAYQVQSIQLKSACGYEVDKLITRQEQTRLRTIAINFLLSDI